MRSCRSSASSRRQRPRDVLEALPVPVGEQLRYAIVVGQKQIWIAGAEEVRGDERQRPAPAADSHRFGAILERPVAAIAQQILAAAVGRILETLRHDPCRLELPEV